MIIDKTDMIPKKTRNFLRKSSIEKVCNKSSNSRQMHFEFNSMLFSVRLQLFFSSFKRAIKILIMKVKSIKQVLLLIPIILGFNHLQAQATKQKVNPGINLNDMDKKVRPNDDFYRYVNGSWLDKTEIPSDKTSYGSSYILYEKTEKDALNILKDAAKNPSYKADSDQGKTVTFYKSIIDTVSRNAQGISPIKKYLDRINAIKTNEDLLKLMIEMEPIGGIGFFSTGIGADDKDSNKNSIYLSPGSLGLPDQEFYISEEKDMKEKREKYVAHVAKMLGFLQDDTSANNLISAKKILELETEMSKPRLNRVERRDSRKQYNPMTLMELQKMVPAVNWVDYFAGLGFKKVDVIIVSQPRYMQALQSLLVANKLEECKHYMRWTLLNKTAGQLSNKIGDANFSFYGTTLNGILKRRPLEERALQTVNNSIGEALGKLYVDKMFPAEAKAKAEQMIRNIIKAYEGRINNLSWMSSTTKVKAIEKLQKMIIKIGYPDQWKDYSTLSIKAVNDGGSFYENSCAISRWNFNKDLNKLDKPVDKTEWFMSPQTVNAYYNPSYNEIVFPAAILQAPYYNYQADEAINYGAIGAVIGHEISHGFDDSGSRYNADGNLVDWWTEEDLKQFEALGALLADQYTAVEVLPNVKVDGKFTLGENIGDLGGINAAYDGLQMYLKTQPKQPLIDGFTPEQRFFISWATVWRSKSREEAIKTQVKTDPHAPDEIRGYLPLMNVDAFYNAFNIKPGDKMYLAPEKRVKIW
jgi:putative endopeptidase